MKLILKTDKTFADTKAAELDWLASARDIIEAFLKQEGELKTDRKYGHLFRPDHYGALRSVTSGMHLSAEDALNECLELIKDEPAALVQEYELHETRAGLFKKQYTCELKYRNERFSGFEETALKLARAFDSRRPPDDEKAAQYLRLCDGTDPEAAKLMAGNPFTDDCKDAEKLYKKGLSLLSGSEEGLWTRAALYVLRAADAGHVPAQLKAGEIYENGTGLAADSDKALMYYRLAADNGDIKARFKAGALHAKKGTANDLEQAFRYFRMAADGGDPEAQYRTAICLAEGRGTKRNEEAALKYLKLAADQGNEAALKKLSTLDNGGKTGELVRLAEQGNPTAMVKVALAMLGGKGMDKDPERAAALLKKAADLGSKEAKYRLGICYKNGWGTGRDCDLAMEYLREAAEDGHLKAYAEAENLENEIRRFNEGEELSRYISRLHDEQRFEEIFEIYTGHEDILQDKDAVRSAFKDYVEKAAGTGNVADIADKCLLPENMDAGDYFYDIAETFERENRMDCAVTAYAYAALEGSRKAFAVLSSMAADNGRYFISVDETLLV